MAGESGSFVGKDSPNQQNGGNLVSKTLQQVIGYILGGTLVGLVIPYGIYRVSEYLDPILSFQLHLTEQLRIGLMCVLFLIGFVFGIWSIVIQNIVGKGGPVQFGNVEISPKTQNLIVTGPYKYTRNPMLFGACMMYFAFAFYLKSVTAMIAVALFMLFMLTFVVSSEEKRLLKDFGAPYEAYRRKVSLFIPWFPKK